jgi:uncharacterized 2Fe-2S/4Fe-4S cluster protein (DUF4445 family)
MLKKIKVEDVPPAPRWRGHIRFGLRAAPGAIERIRIDPQTLEVSFKIIGEKRWRLEFRFTGVKGICSSGIIDKRFSVSREYCHTNVWMPFR